MSEQKSVTVYSRAPVRVDLAGGWTDVAEFARDTPGAVVNLTTQLFSYVTLKTLPVEEGVSIFTADFEQFVTARDIQEIEYDGHVDLVKAAMEMLDIRAGISIQARSDAPPGSGLGTSAAMGVALLGALGRVCGGDYLNYEIAELASQIERFKLNIRGGKQDHYASAIGGLNFMEFFGETVRTAPIPVSEWTRMYLEKHCVLVYTNKSRLSGDIHTQVLDAYNSGDRRTVEAIAEMKRCARELLNCLKAGQCEAIGELISRNWACQKALHPVVTNSQLDELFELALRSGAAGGKACGAGGGGCFVFIAEPDREHQLRSALKSLPGITILPFAIQSSGLRIAMRHSEDDSEVSAPSRLVRPIHMQVPVGSGTEARA